jgi:hypothetical protein
MKKLTILFLSVIFLSCNKKDQTPDCSKSAVSISGSYKMTALTYKANSSSSEQDILYLYAPDACDRDDIYMFQANGTYQLKDAGIVCTPSNDDNGTWSVAGNTMMMDGDNYVIESFDCKILILSQTDPQTTEKIKATFTRQ